MAGLAAALLGALLLGLLSTLGGPNYAYNLLCWTLAFLPGFAALLLRAAPAKTEPSRS
jgi:thiamine transporter ThiT